jgi:hypothetical protein
METVVFEVLARSDRIVSSVALSGRVAVGNSPRAKALGYSILPFHGRSACRPSTPQVCGQPRGVAGAPAPRLFVLERRDIDHKPVFHLAFDRALVSLADLLDRNHFHVGCDVMLSTVVQHLLSFRDTADH